MAEQARKFGAAIAETRKDLHWEQKDLVAKMAELGDASLNTNQLSRYENGGAFPRESRQLLFSKALGVEVADLVAGPKSERNSAKGSRDQLNGSSGQSDAAEAILSKLDEVLDQQAQLLAEISEVHNDLEDLRRRQGPGEHGQEGSGN